MKAISDLQTLNALKISFNWDLSYDLDFVEDLKQIGINCNNLKPFSLKTCFDLFINNDIFKSMGLFVTINRLELNFWGKYSGNERFWRTIKC